MPQAETKAAEGVRLVLTDPKPSYQPGDTLKGQVTWKSYQIGFVRLRLFGRIKTKIERKHSTRGRAVLFDLTEVLHVGEPHKNEEQTRLFSITIPTTIQNQVKAVGQGGQIGVKAEWRESPDFLASSQNKGDLPLPFSYYFNAASAGVAAEAFVEYVLQVETAVTENASKNEIALGITAIPLVIRMPKTDPLDIVVKPKAKTFSRTIIAHSIDVNFDKSTLTLRQKMKKTFRSTSFPKFSFDIRVDVPSCIQLDDPTPFPFQISLWPDLRPDQTTVCPDGDISKVPEIRITSFKLNLRSTTHIRCPASWMDDESDKTHDHKWEVTGPIDYVIPIGGTRDPPLTPAAYLAAQRLPPKPPLDALDLGEILGLRLSPLTTETSGLQSQPLVRPVWPSFKTFNINVSYDLQYKIDLECLGEKERIESLFGPTSRTTVDILPPAHDRHTQMKTKKGDFNAVGLAMEGGDLAFKILQGVLL